VQGGEREGAGTFKEHGEYFPVSVSTVKSHLFFLRRLTSETQILGYTESGMFPSSTLPGLQLEDILTPCGDEGFT
jgi:hypothetical protein